jgi:hypothetical protein
LEVAEMWTRAAIIITGLILAGCATGSLPLGNWRQSPRPCWYDKSKGPGSPYQDAEGTYYIGKNSASNSYYKIRGGNAPRNPYVYQPGSAYWNQLYQFNIYRPYFTPNCRRR